MKTFQGRYGLAELEESVDMAISALEKQTNTAELPTKYHKDDLIHRETARRIIDSNRNKEQTLVTKDGETVYLTDGHIECMLDYEQQKILKDIIAKNPICELKAE